MISNLGDKYKADFLDMEGMDKESHQHPGVSTIHFWVYETKHFHDLTSRDAIINVLCKPQSIYKLGWTSVGSHTSKINDF